MEAPFTAQPIDVDIAPASPLRPIPVRGDDRVFDAPMGVSYDANVFNELSCQVPASTSTSTSDANVISATSHAFDASQLVEVTFTAQPIDGDFAPASPLRPIPVSGVFRAFDAPMGVSYDVNVFNELSYQVPAPTTTSTSDVNVISVDVISVDNAIPHAFDVSQLMEASSSDVYRATDRC
jgi:hypothetical protein